MNETSHRFGRHDQLTGILTEPTVAPRGVGVVLINAGLVPKFGHYRLYVELARRFARAGFHVLRFDLGGIGDSQVDEPSRPLIERTEVDVAAALDALFRIAPVRSAVLGGLCSGAEDAFRAAARDPRVSNVLLVDPFSYRTSDWAWRHTVHRATRRTLRALGRYEPLPIRSASGESPAVESLVSYTYMEHAESSQILQALIARGTRSHFIYTGGKAGSFNHASQLQAMFPAIDFRGLVTVDYLPQLDHLQVLAGDRLRIVETFARRLTAAHPSPSRLRRLTSLPGALKR